MSTKDTKPPRTGAPELRAHLACGVSLAQISQMQLAANGAGECPSANNARGARGTFAGSMVNNRENGALAIAAASSRPAGCWTGAGCSCPG